MVNKRNKTHTHLSPGEGAKQLISHTLLVVMQNTTAILAVSYEGKHTLII